MDLSSFPRIANITEIYDVFVSYNSKDEDKSLDVAIRLQQFGFSVWKDNWVLTGGDEWIDKLPDAVSNSRTMIFLLGEHGEGPWHSKELKLAIKNEVENETMRIIPVFLPGYDKSKKVPPYLGSKTIIDLGDMSDWAFYLLRCAIRGESPIRRDLFDKDSEPQFALARLKFVSWEITHDRAKYSVNLRVTNSGSDTIVVTSALIRIKRIAKHPIEDQLIAFTKPIRKNILKDDLYLPKRGAGKDSFLMSGFTTHSSLTTNEVEDLVIPFYVKYGYRLVVSIGIFWYILGDSTQRLSEGGYLAVGCRGKEEDNYEVPNLPEHYFMEQHSLDIPYMLSTDNWPTHWPEGVSEEEWEAYGGGERKKM